MSNNLGRKIKRKKMLKEEKEAEKQLEKKLQGIFLPDECSNCKEPFDKKSREMAMTWKVIANPERKHLICPTCWDAIERIDPLAGTRGSQHDQHQPQSHTEPASEK